MRVISGKYRGKNLLSPQGNEVRPTLDRVKETIFNVIQFEIPSSRFLDLFSGTGSIGIEAISRGAREVIFSDFSKNSIDMINKNLNGINENYRVLNKDYKDTLKYVNGQFDFIFIDAPYALNCIEDILNIIKAKDLLSDNGYIIYEHDKNKNFIISCDYYIYKRKEMGIVVVDYIKKVNSICAITGSFDPITLGHIDIVDKIYDKFDKIVLLIAQNDEKKGILTLNERREIAKLALLDKLNIYVDICDGFVYKYLNEHNIETIVRGFRNNNDFNYEEKMAKYNKEHGGVTTILLEANPILEDVSSTRVRQNIKNGESIKKMVPSNVLKIIEKKYKEKI